MENFAENYYPKDLQTEKKTEQQVRSQIFPTEMLFSLLGQDPNKLSTILQGKNFQNDLFGMLSPMLNRQTSSKKKTFDDDCYEQY